MRDTCSSLRVVSHGFPFSDWKLEAPRVTVSRNLHLCIDRRAHRRRRQILRVLKERADVTFNDTRRFAITRAYYLYVRLIIVQIFLRGAFITSRIEHSYLFPRLARPSSPCVQVNLFHFRPLATPAKQSST